MATATRAKKSRPEEDDRISGLPDGVLGDIISLLPTMDGGRTQVISSRWRHLWRTAAPLNVDLHACRFSKHIPEVGEIAEISRILSTHPGPGRRFSVPFRCSTVDLDAWLRSPALDNLQELEFHRGFASPPLPLPASVRRFSSTLRVASFGGCSFPDGGSNDSSALCLPLLKQLSLLDVKISESSLCSLLDGCPVLESLLLTEDTGCSPIRIMSGTLKSIGLQSGCGAITFPELIIEDAPLLERFIFVGTRFPRVAVSVISAPKLEVLGNLPGHGSIVKFGTTIIIPGSCVLKLMTGVRSLKTLALTDTNLSLASVIDFMKCFPFLENLYIELEKLYNEPIMSEETNPWCHKDRNLLGTLDIRLKKIVVANYRGYKSHVYFARFFVLNAKVLQSMKLALDVRIPNNLWVEKQYRLIQIKDRASRQARFDFVSCDSLPFSFRSGDAKQVHDLSIADPFV